MENQNSKIQEFADSLIPESFKQTKFFSVMFFYSRSELGIPKEICPETYIYRGSRRFTDYQAALSLYANTPCPASQLIKAETECELELKEKEMIDNFKNEVWLQENVFPYI